MGIPATPPQFARPKKKKTTPEFGDNIILEHCIVVTGPSKKYFNNYFGALTKDQCSKIMFRIKIPRLVFFLLQRNWKRFDLTPQKKTRKYFWSTGHWSVLQKYFLVFFFAMFFFGRANCGGVAGMPMFSRTLPKIGVCVQNCVFWLIKWRVFK